MLLPTCVTLATPRADIASQKLNLYEQVSVPSVRSLYVTPI